MTGLLILAAATAVAEPFTYGEALSGALEHNGLLADALAVASSAEGVVRANQGVFDPLYEIQASTTRSKFEGFFQGFPFSSSEKSWFVETRVGGTTGTGTSYSVAWNLDRDTARYTTVIQDNADTQLQDAYASNLTASITQQLLRGVWFKYNVQTITDARANLTVAQLMVERQRQDVLQLAADAYWKWAFQVELVRIAEEALAVAEEAQRVGRLQVESGQLAPVEGTRLAAARVQARQDLLDAEQAAEAAANTLLVTTGASPTRNISPATAPGEVPVIDLDAALAIQVAMAQNLDLVVARAELDAAHVSLSSTKHGLLPVLSATAAGGLGSNVCVLGSDAAQLDECEVGGADEAVTGVFERDNLPFFSISGLFQVPIGNRGARGVRDTAAALVWQRTSALEAMERRVAADVENQVHLLEAARQRVELADANERLAVETLAAEEALAEAGRAIQKDVLEARTDVTRARAEAANARTTYRLAQTRLLQLQGQLTETTP
jgi:outer membrane protein TolC